MNTPIIIKQIISATPEKIWKAITDKEQMKQWYFDIPDFELNLGAVFNFYEPGGANKYHHQCTIAEIVPNKKLRHTWTHPSHSTGTSMLTWEIEADGANSKVILTHAGIENFADGGPDFNRENYEAGWQEIVGKMLKEFVEK